MIDQYDCNIFCVVCGKEVHLMDTHDGDFETCSEECNAKKNKSRKAKKATITYGNCDYYDKEGNLLNVGDGVFYKGKKTTLINVGTYLACDLSPNKILTTIEDMQHVLKAN